MAASIPMPKLKRSHSTPASTLGTVVYDPLTEESAKKGHHLFIAIRPHDSTGPSVEASKLNDDSHVALVKSTLLVHNASQAVQKVRVELFQIENKLKRKSWWPLLYPIVLILYTVLGGLIFQAVEGPIDDRLIAVFNHRCVDARNNATLQLYSFMMKKGANRSAAEMFHAANATIMAVDYCIRRSHPNALLSMSSLSNAICFAATIYTTLGYGNLAPKTVTGRILTMIYATIGIPFFLASIADWGLMLSNFFKWISARVGRRIRRWRAKGNEAVEDNNQQQLATVQVQAKQLEDEEPVDEKPLVSPHNETLRDLRRFGIITAIFIIYFLVVSAIFEALEASEKWSYMDALHFVFTSVTLIGFGDLTPADDTLFLCVELPLIFLGMILIAMAYFFMQEEIRTRPGKVERSVRCTSSLRTAPIGMTDAATQYSGDIDESETSLSPSTPVKMTLCNSCSTIDPRINSTADDQPQPSSKNDLM